MKRMLITIIGASVVFLFTFCGVANLFSAKYYRLLEKERKFYLGLQGIDSIAAVQYISLESPTERAQFYDSYWENRKEGEQAEFEERCEFAFRHYGKFAPLSDDRIQVYVKYGPPTRREEIIPQKNIAIRTDEKVNPVEIWTYNKEGLIFDFIRLARAFELINISRFGDEVLIPHFNEAPVESVIDVVLPGLLDLSVAAGRFRQKKNLTRLELYITVSMQDTVDASFMRTIHVYNAIDSIVQTDQHMLQPVDGANGAFFDEVNFWLNPEDYRLEIEIIDGKNNLVGKEILWSSLIDYQDDAKEISDLVPALLIDKSHTHEKFDKPVGRVIPLTRPVVPMFHLFYFYAEVYNLAMVDGLHKVKTTYEITNREKMRREVVDVMIKDHVDAGDVAYLGAIYHPMDLSPGHYIITLKALDLISGQERTAISEFELVK
ncbi:GWxTD domain-containing protein [candidate division WOR-3 bacterium]|nr:GWxTD domain-containing protein [candidate division WOR-3 bacterium]